MNKKIISFLLVSVCFFVFASGLFACGDSLKTTNDDNEIGSNPNLEFEITYDNGIFYSVVGYKEFFNDERDNEIVIPSLYKGRPVTSIGNRAFFDCSSLTSIKIPEGVTSIGWGAFYGCRNLTSIEIPNSVKSIGSDAFSGCDKLDFREYDNGYYLGNKDNPYIAFIKVKTTDIESCLINNDCMVIGECAFAWCSRLTSIEISSSVTSIGNRAFFDCSSLTSIKIPEGVTSIGNEAFSACGSLTSIEIPSSVTSIGEDAFSVCDKLEFREYDNGYYLGNKDNPYIAFIKVKTEYVESCLINNDCMVIGEGAFKDCSNLTSIEIPSSVTSIGEYAFSGCSSLTSINIPEGVTSIGWSAFYRCSSLTSIEIPSSVTSIDDGAFYDCDNLVIISVSENNSNYKSIDGNLYSKDGTILLQYAIGKQDMSFTIPNCVKSIESYAFAWCSSLTSIKIPEGVTNIELYAFAWCSSLISVEIPSSVKSIGNCAFARCTSLTSITLPSSITSIGSNAFSGCESLTKVYYTGTSEQWSNITIYSGNECLASATIYYNS